MATVHINKSGLSSKLALLAIATAILGSALITAVLIVTTVIIGILEES